jgi:hypothetical protein
MAIGQQEELNMEFLMKRGYGRPSIFLMCKEEGESLDQLFSN